jgi:predicted  nucleic acid-binding Zn-ribbon protein
MNTKIHIIIFGILVVAAGFFCDDQSFVDAETSDEMTEEEKKELEEKEEEYEEKKEKYEEKLEKVQNEKSQLQNNLNSVNYSLNTTRRTIDDVLSDIKEKESDIDRHNAQIISLEGQITLYQRSLAEMMRRVYYTQHTRSLSSVVENDGTRRFMERSNDLGDVRQKVVTVVHQIDDAKELQKQKKKELEQLKEEKETLLQEHKKKEATLLSQSAAVQTEIFKVDTTLAELNAKLSAVESKLSALLGDSFSTDDIVEAAKFASKKTDVRKSFLLGMLVVETDLGRFTGGCTYKESKMGDKNEDIFKRICKDLDYNYKKVKVSCPLSYGIGGAMGVAQFMPTTWAGYESKIEKYTGHSPADPWSLTDGVMAMAIKLANDGATSEKGEYNAARRYYCGSNIDRSVCVNYGNKVKYWAENYKDRL